MTPYSIILFDGYCNLCNGFVNFIIQRDPTHKFKFAASQSDVGEMLIKKYNLTESQFKSVVLILPDETVIMKSTAALQILQQLTFPTQLLFYFSFFPKFIRDWVYDFISKNRYKLFGKQNICRLPSENEKLRFL